jgi:hypothetical protein
VVTTKAAETHAALSQLMEGGMRLSDAVRAYADDTGRSEAAVRASYYQQRAKLGDNATSSRRHRAVSVEDAIDEARALLQRAIDQIDAEVEAAKADAVAARQRYEVLKADAARRKAELERKIAALAP